MPFKNFLYRNWALAVIAPAFSYIIFVFLLTIPSVQRNALYAHKANPALFQNLSNIEQFGFHHSQVQPFRLTTSDNVTLHAWHIIPTHLYLEHEYEFSKHWQPPFNRTSGNARLDQIECYPSESCLLSWLLLFSNPAAHVIISFHGNAAHLASSYRPTTYQHLLGLSSPTRPIHVIAFDYRGFGLSNGSPTEEGLIEDGFTILSFLTDFYPFNVDPTVFPRQARTLPAVHPGRITLLGQSLGTAVATGVYHKWTLLYRLPSPHSLILLASFSSLSSLLNSYSIKGLLPPMLNPLDHFHLSLKPWILTYLADTWLTSNRLTDLIISPQSLDLTIMHARDDWEIPYAEGRRNFDALVSLFNSTPETQGTWKVGADGGDIQEWESTDQIKRLRWELISHGGHNRVAVGEQMKAAVLRSLDRSKPEGQLERKAGMVGRWLGLKSSIGVG